jgi:hypothetical protein
MQNIGQGNNGEEDRKKASQRNNALAPAQAARISRLTNCEAVKKKSVTIGGANGPHEVKCEFHYPRRK